MILKSMARKGPSFQQLVDYIDQGTAPGDLVFVRNLQSLQLALVMAAGWKQCQTDLL